MGDDLLTYIPKNSRTHLSVDLPKTFREREDSGGVSPWRRCRQCAHPFPRIKNVCPKCGKNQEDLTTKSLEEIRKEAPKIIDNFIKKFYDAISSRNRKPRR